MILTNPPYSQKTRHGNLYDIPGNNGDAIAIKHCFRALKQDGRAAILVKDDFLTEGGDAGQVRDMILKMSRNVSLVSLPRRLFEPYTPTKTSILYFEKAGSRRSVFFFIVNKVGHTFGARKTSLPENDLPRVLESMHAKVSDDFSCDGFIVDQGRVLEASSLWPYDYTEVLPPTAKPLTTLGSLIAPSGTQFEPKDYPDDVFRILGVSNDVGVFMNEEKQGSDIRQKYIRVSAGDLVYNPHRVNVGSIGLVPDELDSGIVSGIYVVFRPKDPELLPSAYILRLLKSSVYLRIIRAYDTRGSVRANLSWEQLCRIKLAVPSPNEVKIFMAQHAEVETLREKVANMESGLSKMVSGETPAPTGNKTAFDALLRRAVPDEAGSPESETSDPA